MDVVCAIMMENGKVLATRRGPSSDRAGKWEFPGGKVRNNERPELAIIREIHEELGIKISVMHQLPRIVHRYPDITIRLMPFICKWEKGDIQLRDHDEFVWIPGNKLYLYDWSEADKSLILLIQNSTSFLNGPVV